MSAWMVDKTHVDLLVRAAFEYGSAGEPLSWWQVDGDGDYAGWRRLDRDAESYQESEQERRGLITPSRLGQLLVDENVASVSYRYPNDDVDAGELPGPCDAYYIGPYVYADPGCVLSPGELFRAIDCFDYQACEHPDWRTSEAFRFLEALREAAGCRTAGYETSPWGWGAHDLHERVKAGESRAAG